MLLRWKLERELRNDCSNIGEVHFGPMENVGGGWRYEQSNDGKLIRYREGLDNVPQQVVVPTLSHCVSVRRRGPNHASFPPMADLLLYRIRYRIVIDGVPIWLLVQRNASNFMFVTLVAITARPFVWEQM